MVYIKPNSADTLSFGVDGGISFGQPQGNMSSPITPGYSSTGNADMDKLLREQQQQTDFLNQARQADISNQWERTLASQNGFGSRYQHGRLIGQQLFSDILAPMLAGNSAGGAAGAYEFIKDSNRRIDDGLAQQTTDRLKTAQALDALADMAHKGKASEFQRMGQTIGLYKAAASINNQQQMQKYHEAATKSAEIKAAEDARMTEDNVRKNKYDADTAVTKSRTAIQDLEKTRIEKTNSYYKMLDELRAYKESIALAPSKAEREKYDAMKAKLQAEGESIRNLKDQQAMNNDNAKLQNDTRIADARAAESGQRRTESGGRTDLNAEKLRTQRQKTAYAKTQAAGIDKGLQRDIAASVDGARGRGASDDDIRKALTKKYAKDPSMISQFERYMNYKDKPDEEAAKEDDRPVED